MKDTWHFMIGLLYRFTYILSSEKKQIWQQTHRQSKESRENILSILFYFKGLSRILTDFAQLIILIN